MSKPNKFKLFNGKRYFLKRFFPFKSSANLEVLSLRVRGYKARVVLVSSGWAVYYR